MINKKIYAFLYNHDTLGIIITLMASDFGETINNECFPFKNNIQLLLVNSLIDYRFNLKNNYRVSWRISQHQRTPNYFYVPRPYVLEIYNGKEVIKRSSQACIVYGRPYKMPSLLLKACKIITPNLDMRKTRNEILTKLNDPHFKELCQIVESGQTYHELRLKLLHEDLFQKNQD